jgi:RNA polymerase sigma factor (sigma-70 family)
LPQEIPPNGVRLQHRNDGCATVRVDGVSKDGMNAPKPASIDDDRALVADVLARTPGAFERLVRTYQGLCWHVINRMVRHPEDAREVCQEAFLRVHTCLHQYRFQSALKYWIAQVAYSVAVRHLQRKRIPLVVSDDTDVAELLDQVSDDFDLEAASTDTELVAALHAEIEALPPLQRTVLTLYYLEEMPIDEIARITGLVPGTIKSHLFRSRARLRERLEARMGVVE